MPILSDFYGVSADCAGSNSLRTQDDNILNTIFFTLFNKLIVCLSRQKRKQTACGWFGIYVKSGEKRDILSRKCNKIIYDLVVFINK